MTNVKGASWTVKAKGERERNREGAEKRGSGRHDVKAETEFLA